MPAVPSVMMAVGDWLLDVGAAPHCPAGHFSPFTARQSQMRRDPHSGRLSRPPLPRTTGERKGASLPNSAPFLSLRRGERWRRAAATEWGNSIRDCPS